MIARAGNATDTSGSVLNPEARERQLILEALLPEKERMLSLARQTLSDPEPQVTALCSSVLSAMAWWP